MVVGSGLCVVMALMMAVSVEPTYITRLASPGAMPSAWVMSSVCSVSSHAGLNDATRAGSVGREQRDRHAVGLVDVRVVGVQVGQVGAEVFEQSEVLAAPVRAVPP